MQQTAQIVPGLSVTVAHGNYASASILNGWNRGGTVSYSERIVPDVYAMRRALPRSPSVCLPKTRGLRQDARAVCDF